MSDALHHLNAALAAARDARAHAPRAGQYVLAVRWERIIERIQRLIEMLHDELGEG